MKKLAQILLLSVLSIFLLAGSAQATLLGLNLGLPDILSDQTGSYNYNATSDLFTSTATPQTITFDGINLISITGTPTYAVSFYVDSSGNFVSGVPGPGYDLEIYGDIDVDGDNVIDYSGLLVAGEVTAFGFLDTGTTTDLFDFTFDVDSSSLLYGFFGTAAVGGDITTAEASTFTGDWTVNHSGTKVKHDTAPVPEPATMLLFGAGLIGLAAFSRKKFFKT